MFAPPSLGDWGYALADVGLPNYSKTRILNMRRYVRRRREMRLRADERAAATRGRVAELEVT